MTTVDYYMIYATISQGRLLSKFQLTDMELEMARASVPGKGGGAPSRAAKTF